MTPDEAELRRLAEAATSGPWYEEALSGDEQRVCSIQEQDNRAICYPDRWNNAQFIAKANPAVVIALLDRIKTLEAERDAERLRYGQQRASNAVLMRGLADAARQGVERTDVWVQRADEAATNVRLEDFTTAESR